MADKKKSAGTGKEYTVKHGILGITNPDTGEYYREGDKIKASQAGDELDRLLAAGAIGQDEAEAEADADADATGLYTPAAPVGSDVVVIADEHVAVQPSHDNQSQG